MQEIKWIIEIYNIGRTYKLTRKKKKRKLAILHLVILKSLETPTINWLSAMLKKKITFLISFLSRLTSVKKKRNIVLKITKFLYI